jgi:muramoyltetrapeptide carboxypeptidase
MTSNHPPYLKKGSTIGITCPSSHIPLERIQFAAEVLQLWGFNVKLGATAGKMHHYFAGTDEERLDDLQAMLNDDSIDAILMGRGGYGMSRIIDKLDFTMYLQKPKWVCGFSDIVVLLNHLQAKYNIASLHSPMCNAYKSEYINSDHLQNFYAALTGESLYYNIPASPYNRTGTVEGILTGGNLSILAHLTGSSSEVDTNGKILFLEDIGEYLYNIDRLLLNLKRGGKFDNLKGLILGGFSDMQDTDRPFGQTVEEIIWDKVKEYNYPVCFNFPVGHIDINYTLTMGMPHKLIVTPAGAELKLEKKIS